MALAFMTSHTIRKPNVKKKKLAGWGKDQTSKSEAMVLSRKKGVALTPGSEGSPAPGGGAQVSWGVIHE